LIAPHFGHSSQGEGFGGGVTLRLSVGTVPDAVRGRAGRTPAGTARDDCTSICWHKRRNASGPNRTGRDVRSAAAGDKDRRELWLW